MNLLLESLRPVIEGAKYVKIHEPALQQFCDTLSFSDLEHSQIPFYNIPENFTREQIVALSVVYNALNFCFWGEPKWKIMVDGQEYGGSEGTVKSLLQAFSRGFNILDPYVLQELTAEQLQTVFQGTNLIPLFDERLEMLREVGRVVIEKYHGEFQNIILSAEEDALKIVKLLKEDFPHVFNDVALYQGKEVQFFKRAQLVPIDLHQRSLVKPNLFSFQNIHELTALADYKIPMVLREFGILVYAEQLANKVDNKIELAAASEEEIEIRASMIWAVEMMKQYLQRKFPEVTATQISDIFWNRRREVEKTARPHHRTRTVWY